MQTLLYQLDRKLEKHKQQALEDQRARDLAYTRDQEARAVEAAKKEAERLENYYQDQRDLTESLRRRGRKGSTAGKDTANRSRRGRR